MESNLKLDFLELVESIFDVQAALQWANQKYRLNDFDGKLEEEVLRVITMMITFKLGAEI